VADRPAVNGSTGEGELVEFAARNGAIAARPPDAGGTLEPDEREPFGRFRRRFERIKGLPTPHEEPLALGGEAELKLQLMLLREENARLKSARHQPASPGSVIDRVRVLAASGAEGDALDDAWGVLSECLAIREGLDQVCAEIQHAIDRVRERLAALTLSGEDEPAEIESGADAASSFPA
jgi:hypothetical protein